MNAPVPQYTTREQRTLNIFQRHYAAFTAGDLEAVLNDFGEDSVVITSDGPFEGRERIARVFRALIAEFGVIDRGDSPGFTLDALQVRHDTLFIAWHAESMRRVFPFGTDTFICDGDKIVRQSIAFSPPRAKGG